MTSSRHANRPRSSSGEVSRLTPGVAAWKTRVKQQGASACRTLSGRRRWSTQPPLTEQLNTPVQGTGADILTRALGLLPQALKGTGDFRDARGEATLVVTTLESIDVTFDLD
jgi:hypothetical protein